MSFVLYTIDVEYMCNASYVTWKCRQYSRYHVIFARKYKTFLLFCATLYRTHSTCRIITLFDFYNQSRKYLFSDECNEVHWFNGSFSKVVCVLRIFSIILCWTPINTQAFSKFDWNWTEVLWVIDWLCRVLRRIGNISTI